MQLHGFELVFDTTIQEYNTRARFYRHLQSGAELLSLENDDENKVFGVVFRTPPPDSTGIAHILEHAVLGGSRKYPLKEPFIQLVKGSLKTFLNAMTYPDRTVYPVASQNLKDFYNLVDVYLDAVFHPLITPHHLQQEGWHYELEDMDAPLLYKGVVYNEMKGAYSSPDSLLYRHSQRALFPDNAYGYDSGGDPAVIPQLTYEQFKAFHTTYYHPSNALLYFYGDDPLEERLRIANEYLREFHATKVDAIVPLQAPFQGGPQRKVVPYGVDAQNGSGAAPKSMVQVNWRLPESDDPELIMGLSLLSYALISTQASPLRKALLDSGLGEDVTGGGLNTSLRQMTFSAGLKGVESANVDKVEQLIFDTLKQLADNGFDPDMIEAAYNTIEFSLRENNTGSAPRGLNLMMRALRNWLYGRDILAPLAFAAPLAAVRRNLDSDPHYLQKFIRTYLLDNDQRVTVVLEPDADYNRRLENAEKERLAQARAQMSPEELQAIIENTRTLRKLQETPDSPDLLAKLPMLKVGDLDREVKTIPLAESKAHDATILYHDLFTNGIVYLDLAFNLRTVPAELLPYARLFAQALVEIGTEKEDFVKLSQRIGRETGGIYPSNFVSAKRNATEPEAWLLLHGKSTTTQAPEMLAILTDILLTVKLDNQERFRQMVLKAKAGKESGLIPGGSAVVDGRLRAAYDKASWVAEQMGGIDHLFVLRRLVDEVNNNWPAVLARLEEVRRLIINRKGMIANVTLDEANWKEFEPQLHGFLAGLPAHDTPFAVWTPPSIVNDEGLALPAQVNYVGKGTDLYSLGYKLHGSVHVILNFLRTGYLWDKIRVQGGAYGALSRFSPQSGVLTFASYRDPNLLATLDVYDNAAQFLREVELDDDELTKNIIGAIGTLDAYQLPDAKGYTSMVRYLLGETDAERQQRRDEVLSTGPEHFRAFADMLDGLRQTGRVVVLGSQDALNEAKNARNGRFDILKIL